MSGHWAAKYSDDQRAAVVYAGTVLGVRPFSKIAAMAAAGELRTEPRAPFLEPFEIPQASARAMVRKAERRKAGTLPAALAKQGPRDRAETLQRRLTALADLEMERCEKQAAKGKPLDPEHLRKMARLLKELATVPAPEEKRLPLANGATSATAPTTDSMAGKILAAADASARPTVKDRLNGPDPAPDPLLLPGGEQHALTEAGPHREHQHADQRLNGEDHDAPCSSEDAPVSGADGAPGLVAAAVRVAGVRAA